MCIGIDHCSKKSCLENEKCVLSLKTKILGPEVLGAIDLQKFDLRCKHSKRICVNERACYLIGCVRNNPLVKADKLATKQLKGKHNIGYILEVLTRLAPHLNKTYKTKRNNKKLK